MLRRYLLWPAAACGSLLLLLLSAIVLGPAVARAQFVADGGATVAEILAALVGQPVAAERYTASATSGAGYACLSASATCLDPGPGAHNGICTNVAGDIVLGCGSTSTVVRVGEGCSMTTNQVSCTNGAFNFDGSVLRNNIGSQGGTVHVQDPEGLMVNSGTPLTKRLRQTTTLDFGEVAAFPAVAVLTATVTGAATGGDTVDVTPCDGLEDGIGDLEAWVSAADTVSLRVRNLTGSPLNPAACAFTFEVRR